MATALAIITDALIEIGAYQDGEPIASADANRALTRFQNQIDAWAAQRLTLSLQLRTTFTLTSGTTSVTLGPTGADVTMGRPVWIDTLTYVIPGSSPSVEVPIGLMDPDAYAALSIKGQTSALPLQAYYQTNLTDSKGTLTFWPVVTQNVGIVIYAPQAVTVPAALTTVVAGPPGYAEAFMYQLALRLCGPFGVDSQTQQRVAAMAGMATVNMMRVNVSPGILGVDPALVPNMGAGYNVYADTTSAWGGN